jgi:small subunit ribosomal protein S8
MAMTDPLGDLLTRIRNGQHARKEKVMSPSSKLKLGVLQVLKDKGFIAGFEEKSLEGNKKVVEITLKEYEGRPVIQKLQRVSTPGRRVYTKVTDMKPTNNGLGISILSTPRGVISDYEARELNVGGEILCSVY